MKISSIIAAPFKWLDQKADDFTAIFWKSRLLLLVVSIFFIYLFFCVVCAVLYPIYLYVGFGDKMVLHFLYPALSFGSVPAAYLIYKIGYHAMARFAIRDSFDTDTKDE